MKYARIVDDKVVEILNENPYKKFTDEIAAMFVECDDEVAKGWHYENGAFVEEKLISQEDLDEEHNNKIFAELESLDKDISKVIVFKDIINSQQVNERVVEIISRRDELVEQLKK